MQSKSRWKRVAPCIYRDLWTDDLYERISNGRQKTWVKFDGVTRIEEAKALRAGRLVMAERVAVGIAPPKPPEFPLVGQVLDHFLESECPGKDRTKSEGTALNQHKSRLKILSLFWAKREVGDIRVKTLDEYADWRKKQKFNGRKTKGRAIDLELNTLRNALYFAVRGEKINGMPSIGTDGKWPVYHNGQKKHCYLYRPDSGDELHNLMRGIFLARGHRSEAAGFLYGFLCMTGSRIGEALAMRRDARPGECGFIESWKFLHTQREKGGVNPWIQIHPALDQLLRAMEVWHATRHPKSPWFFPSWENPAEPLHHDTLGTILDNAAKRLSLPHRTPHGGRAYYVTVRRSQRASDAVIAAEIGHTTGGATLVDSYGGVPQNWYIADHPELTWMPSKGEPAWAALELPLNVITLPQAVTMPQFAAR